MLQLGETIRIEVVTHSAHSQKTSSPGCFIGNVKGWLKVPLVREYSNRWSTKNDVQPSNCLQMSGTSSSPCLFQRLGFTVDFRTVGFSSFFSFVSLAGGLGTVLWLLFSCENKGVFDDDNTAPSWGWKFEFFESCGDARFNRLVVERRGLDGCFGNVT